MELSAFEKTLNSLCNSALELANLKVEFLSGPNGIELSFSRPDNESIVNYFLSKNAITSDGAALSSFVAVNIFYSDNNLRHQDETRNGFLANDIAVDYSKYDESFYSDVYNFFIGLLEAVDNK